MPVVCEIAESATFLRDLVGIFPRYGRHRLVDINDGFDHTFSRRGAQFVPAASRALAAGIVLRMVQRVASGASSPEQATQAAEVEFQALTTSSGPGGPESH